MRFQLTPLLMLATTCGWAILGAMCMGGITPLWTRMRMTAFGTSRKFYGIPIIPTDQGAFLFRVDETGIYDVPAIFGLVLNVTGQDKIHYLGHSMGTTSFFIAMNAQPELANKIKMANLMAPIAYVKHMRSPVIRLVVPFASHAEDFAEWIGFKEVHSNTFTNGMLSRLICNDRSVPELCTSFMFMITGFDRSQVRPHP